MKTLLFAFILLTVFVVTGCKSFFGPGDGYNNHRGHPSSGGCH